MPVEWNPVLEEALIVEIKQQARSKGTDEVESKTSLTSGLGSSGMSAFKKLEVKLPWQAKGEDLLLFCCGLCMRAEHLKVPRDEWMAVFETLPLEEDRNSFFTILLEDKPKTLDAALREMYRGRREVKKVVLIREKEFLRQGKNESAAEFRNRFTCDC
eukprot:TRINITY_DN28933_c0_g1_i1.p1 TRINITY_DN28933_c0_g1~~TRINITY_DN28933_c0_g1_i1.p1  ORF type:complete len:158 (-),score=29.36 TRINITY_DN28933_c0_g1_i1:218-691(-)